MRHFRSNNAQKLVVVPVYTLGFDADTQGLVGRDEVWCTVADVPGLRGIAYREWRYLDTLDRPPAIGSSREVIEAWLERDDHPFPPLDPAVKMALDAMVLLPAPF